MTTPSEETAAAAVTKGTTGTAGTDDANSAQLSSTIPSTFQQMNVSGSNMELLPSSSILLQEDYQRILSVGEECIHANELYDLLLRQGRGSQSRTVTTASTTGTTTTTTHSNTNTNDAIGFTLYDGFEPSGRMHIAQGIYKVHNVNKCTYQNNGGTFLFWIADWFALMNDKMGGDLEKIRIVGFYLIEVWKAAGMNLQNVSFKWASEEITTHAATYWPMMMDICRRFTITRIKKCCQIMGRLENNLSAAQVLYPIMQCTDIFFLKADICQLGVDQRKVNMLAREYCDYAKRKYKPIILSHHMLYGLKQGQEKMSKSDPDSAIFMEDSVEDVQRKIMNAYCPSTVTVADTTTSTTNATTTTTEEMDAGKVSMHLTTDNLKNPILDYLEHIIFSGQNVDESATVSFTVNDIVYTTFQSVKDAFLNGTISEPDLKVALIEKINVLLDPVRHHFTNDANAKHLFEQVQQFKKESSTTTSTKVLRKCNFTEHNKVPKQSHVVLAPLPNLQPTLQEAMDVLVQLRRGASDQPIVLYLQDWTAVVSNACLADIKGIMAYYTILITSLKALDPTFMESSVQILYQSETILSSDPSNYWISVINVGRFFMLHQVMGQNDMVDSDNVGKIIGRLMTVADIVSIDPRSIALSSKKTARTESTLIQQYYTEQLHPIYGLPIPQITLIDCLPIRLQPARESDALITENDEYYLLDDPKVRFATALSTFRLVRW